QTVTVVDTTAPSVLVCPGPVSVKCFAEVPEPDVTLVTGADNCSGQVVVIFAGDSQLSGTTCNGTITRTYKVTDLCGNSSTCTQIITIHDDVLPTITCAANKSVECGMAWKFDAPTATDNCGSATISIVSTTTNALCGSTFSATRTWEATDACGNKAQCSQTVTVVDTTLPTITCSANKTVECTAPWNFNAPTATDT